MCVRIVARLSLLSRADAVTTRAGLSQYLHTRIRLLVSDVQLVSPRRRRIDVYRRVPYTTPVIPAFNSCRLNHINLLSCLFVLCIFRIFFVF